MATPKITWKIFTCIIIPQTCVLHEPWRWNYNSTSNMEGFHSFYLFPIPIKKQDLTGIEITQSGRLWYIFICPLNLHPPKFSHRKIKLAMVIKSTSSSPCQGWNYSFLYNNKTTRQNYPLYESWQQIWPYCCCCIFHDSSTWKTWTQIPRLCDFN